MTCLLFRSSAAFFPGASCTAKHGATKKLSRQSLAWTWLARGVVPSDRCGSSRRCTWTSSHTSFDSCRDDAASNPFVLASLRTLLFISIWRDTHPRTSSYIIFVLDLASAVQATSCLHFRDCAMTGHWSAVLSCGSPSVSVVPCLSPQLNVTSINHEATDHVPLSPSSNYLACAATENSANHVFALTDIFAMCSPPWAWPTCFVHNSAGFRFFLRSR